MFVKQKLKKEKISIRERNTYLNCKWNTAKNNNLNYIELFNFKKLDKLIEIIKNKNYIKNISNLVI